LDCSCGVHGHPLADGHRPGPIWKDLRPTGRRLDSPIQWRNYYDFGDPIGFRLETAVEFLAHQKCKAFDFETKKHDFGFSRYWLPGKAHNDYWRDAEVFGHFIDDVVMRRRELAVEYQPRR
jgi:hypothetical protein